jgi:hypothetical protein
MLYLGNRSGLRTGEIAGLRMADMEYLKDRAIRVRYSYGGPLKEDKGGTGKMKWVPQCVSCVVDGATCLLVCRTAIGCCRALDEEQAQFRAPGTGPAARKNPSAMGDSAALFRRSHTPPRRVVRHQRAPGGRVCRSLGWAKSFLERICAARSVATHQRDALSTKTVDDAVSGLGQMSRAGPYRRSS